MKKLIFLILLIEGYLMGAALLKVNIKGVEVPIIFEKDKRLPIASIEFIFENSGYLASNKAGLVSLAADLLNEGTKKEGSYKFAKELEDRAIDFSVNSGRETLVFTIESLKEQFNFALNKIIELINEPNFTKSSFDKIIKKREGILKNKKSDYDYIAANGLRAILFNNTPLANPMLGTIESIEKLTLDDLKNYINTHLYLNNLIVVVGGDFEEDEVKDIVKNFASNLKEGSVKAISSFKANNKSITKKKEEVTKQAYIYFGSPYNINPSNKKDRVLGRVASFILGSSGFGSRLMEEIRVKRGLAYSAYSYFVVNKTHQYFTGYLQTKLDKQDEAIKVVREVISNFIKNGVSQKELDSAKKFYLGSEPLRSETLAQRLNRAFKEYYNDLGLGFHKEELKMIENINLDELNNFIKKHNEINDLSFFIVTNKK